MISAASLARRCRNLDQSVFVRGNARSQIAFNAPTSSFFFLALSLFLSLLLAHFAFDLFFCTSLPFQLPCLIFLAEFPRFFLPLFSRVFLSPSEGCRDLYGCATSLVIVRVGSRFVCVCVNAKLFCTYLGSTPDGVIR